jgi:glutaredoxin 3
MITVYSKPNCPYCVNAKSWLSANGFQFETIDVTADPKALAFIKERGHMTVPQIYLGETLLVEGGFTGMVKLGATALREKLGS